MWTDGTPGNGMTFETGENAAVAFYTLGGIDADTPYADSPAPLHLGCHNDDTDYLTKRFFKGRLRDARIYTRDLGAEEIAQLYADGPL